MEVRITGDNLQVSDGYHTFEELYDHRIELFIALCRYVQDVDDQPVWRSKLHSDRTMFDGWFVLGIGKKRGKQITYHLPINRWEQTEFAVTRELAPKFDGHTPAQVLARIRALVGVSS